MSSRTRSAAERLLRAIKREDDARLQAKLLEWAIDWVSCGGVILAIEAVGGRDGDLDDRTLGRAENRAAADIRGVLNDWSNGMREDAVQGLPR